MSIGSGTDGELTFLDILGIMSFLIGVQNLDLNVTQDDAQRLEHQTNANAERVLAEIHTHLEEQDRKLDRIIKLMEEKDNGTI